MNEGGERAGELNSREPTLRALTSETAKKNDELSWKTDKFRRRDCVSEGPKTTARTTVTTRQRGTEEEIHFHRAWWGCRLAFGQGIQGSAKRRVPGFVNFVYAIAHANAHAYVNAVT